jgi:alanyl-tRNA synthetase
MTTSELREKYLSFFEKKGHKRIPSASLIPQDDPTTLFTGSGMQPLVSYLLGRPHPEGKRLTNSQKSFRAEDIEEVGDNRHITFFEMLGNWSLGDYFKREQLPWIFEFWTKELGLNPSKLYISVFAGDPVNNIPRDTESVEIWLELFTEAGIEAKEVELGTIEEGGEKGMQGGRIFYYGVEKNWWSRSGQQKDMPPGEPGGPDSEVFYDFGTPHDPRYGKECHPNCDCGRFLEIGNSVFMEYKKEVDGTFSKLPQQNVDFGGGLERTLAAVNNNPDLFAIDTLAAVMNVIREKYGWDYASVGEEEKKRMRIVADHVRSAVFIAAEGVVPSNTKQGYILRRLLRRAIFNAYSLARRFSNLSPITDRVIDSHESLFPELLPQRDKINQIFKEEEARFQQTLEKGKKELERLIAKGAITAKDAFVLFTTYGFPLELTQDEAQRRGLTISAEEFQKEMEKHQEVSRAGLSTKFAGGLVDHDPDTIRHHTATHLLNAALRKVLGEHVGQKGSKVSRERTRFDFTHGEKLTDAQIKKAEELVNEWIKADYPVTVQEMSKYEADRLGAIHAFGERYPDRVTIYTIGDEEKGIIVSREYCGGPHMSRTGELGEFRIEKEEGSSAGVRRIKAHLSK